MGLTFLLPDVRSEKVNYDLLFEQVVLGNIFQATAKVRPVLDSTQYRGIDPSYAMNPVWNWAPFSHRP